MKKLLAMLLVIAMVLSMAACGKKEEKREVVTFDDGDYIWKSSVSTLASNWNPHTYQTTDDAVPLDYTTVGLYSFIFNDALHEVEGKDPYKGYAIVPEMAESEPVDVTEKVKAEHPEFGIPADATAGYAYTIDLNKDACWDDGTPITAETYVESFKRLFAPGMNNYRAPDYYEGDLAIANAEGYAKQGQNVYVDNSEDGSAITYKVEDLVIGADGQYTTPDGKKVYINLYNTSNYLGTSLGYYVDNYGADYFGTTHWETLKGMDKGEGTAPLTAETLPMITDVIAGNPNWGEDASFVPYYLQIADSVWEPMEWSSVGIYASGEYQLTIALKNSLSGFYLLYYGSGLSSPLVKIDLYDKCLIEEKGAGGESVWSSTYNTSVETTASFGPYKMSSFQSSKAMHFVRNDKWYGYTDGEHVYVDPVDNKIYPMYQTTEIDIQVVGESATRKMMFMAGQLMGYGLQAEDYASLRNSEYCYATPSETIFFLILNGNMEAIIERENASDFDKSKQDLEMLTNKAFHQAMGLCYDKDDFAATISPARSGALGIFGTGYIYDPDTGAQYRDSDAAKQVLCDFYGVDATKFDNLDAAVDSITGYDPEQAKVFFKQAFDEGIAAGYITDTNGDGKSDQTIKIEYAMSSEANDFMTKTIKYLNDGVANAAAGTPFEGKIEFTMSAPYGNAWSDKIKQGLADTVLGGWSGSLLNPFSLTDLYTNPTRQYDAAWYDATKVELTINVPVDGKATDVTMSLKQWSDALNGTATEVNGVTYNFGSGQADIEVRLQILAAVEGKILESYNYLPMLQDGSMALLSQQVYYVVEDYNPILGRGGITYTRYNYNEADWAAYVESQGGELKY